jgi:hypothetical protein
MEVGPREAFEQLDELVVTLQFSWVGVVDAK